jgi:hypothetical protein
MPDEELLPGGPHRAIPRWLVVLVVLVVVGGASYVFVRRNHPSPHHAAAPAKPSSAVPSPTIPGVGAPLKLSGGTAVAVAVATDASWVLTTQRLFRFSATASTDSAAVPSPPLPIDGVSVTRLELDQPGHTVWVVHEETKHARIYGYDTSTMRLRRSLGSLGYVTAAAAMHGHLYAAVGDDLIDVAPSGSTRTIVRTRDSIGSIAADPLRGRLLVSDYGDPTRLWSIDPSGAHRLPAPVLVRTTKASLGVAGDGTIWLAGFDTGAGVLMKLDPATLRPVLHSPLDPSIEPGSVLVASGAGVVWIRPGGSDQLNCIDARTGRSLQMWVVAGDVASSAHRALVTTVDGSAGPLRLTRCQG